MSGCNRRQLLGNMFATLMPCFRLVLLPSSGSEINFISFKVAPQITGYNVMARKQFFTVWVSTCPRKMGEMLKILQLLQSFMLLCHLKVFGATKALNSVLS